MERVGVVPEEPDAPREMTPRQLGAFCARLYPSWDAKGYDARLSRFGVPPATAFGRLSKGQKGLTQLSLALAASPELLLLDDPTLGLDPVARHAFFDEIVTELADRGTTVVLTTHDLAGVERIADRVGILKDGRLLLCEETESAEVALPFRPLPERGDRGPDGVRQRAGRDGTAPREGARLGDRGGRHGVSATSASSASPRRTASSTPRPRPSPSKRSSSPWPARRREPPDEALRRRRPSRDRGAALRPRRGRGRRRHPVPRPAPARASRAIRPTSPAGSRPSSSPAPSASEGAFSSAPPSSGRELAERRLSFHFSRPLAAPVVWGGKLAGGLALVLLAELIVFIPSSVASGRFPGLSGSGLDTGLVWAILLLRRSPLPPRLGRLGGAPVALSLARRRPRPPRRASRASSSSSAGAS